MNSHSKQLWQILGKGNEGRVLINPNDAINFQQVGLLSGRFTSWEDSPDKLKELPGKLIELINWALALNPDESRLCINASGLISIYYSLLETVPNAQNYQKKREKLEPLLTQFEVSKSDILSLPGISGLKIPYRNFTAQEAITDTEVEKFEKYIQRLNLISSNTRDYAKTRTPQISIDLEKEDNDWWLDALKKTLKKCVDDLKKAPQSTPDVISTLTAIKQLSLPLQCSVFTPLSLSQMSWGTDPQRKLAAEISKLYTREKLYLVWDLFAFRVWADKWNYQLLHQTVLTLWTAWPDNINWASQPPPEYTSPLFSPEEATFLLTDALPKLSKHLFNKQNEQGFPLKPLQFERLGARQRYYPPTISFVKPVQPALIGTFLNKKAVQDLISKCTQSKDLQSKTISGSKLEGSMIAVRGEVTDEDSTRTQYFIISTLSDKKPCLNLSDVVASLIYQEHTIGLEAEDIGRQAQEIEERRVRDTDSITLIDNFIQKLARLVSTLSTEIVEDITEEFTQLQLLLGYVQHRLRKMLDDANQIKQQYEHLIKRTTEYLEENVVTSPIGKYQDLREALQNAYPYHFLRGRMRILSDYMTQLYNSSERLNTLFNILSISIQRNEQKKRKQSDNVLQFIGAILTIAALCAGLSAWITERWKNGHPHFGVGVIIIIIIIAIASLLSVLWMKREALRRFVRNLFTKSRHGEFRRRIRYVWQLAEYTTYQYDKRQKQTQSPLSCPPPAWFDQQWNNQKADGVDHDATTTLESLWDLLFIDKREINSRGYSVTSYNGFPEVDKSKYIKDEFNEQMQQLRLLKHLILLFLLRPDTLPLPRAACILRYKSIDFFPKPTISENEFRDSLKKCEYSDWQIEALLSWLNDPVNQEWIKAHSVREFAEVLICAGVTKPPTISSSLPTKTLAQHSLLKQLEKLEKDLADPNISLEYKGFLYQDISQRKEAIYEEHKQAHQSSMPSSGNSNMYLKELDDAFERIFIAYMRGLSEPQKPSHKARKLQTRFAGEASIPPDHV